MSTKKKSHSGPTIPAAERAARGQRQRGVRLSAEVDARVAALLSDGRTLAEIVEAGCAALEQQKLQGAKLF